MRVIQRRFRKHWPKRRRDKMIACQMVLQTISCLAQRRRTEYLAKDMLDHLRSKEICGEQIAAFRQLRIEMGLDPFGSDDRVIAAGGVTDELKSIKDLQAQSQKGFDELLR